jgi:phosphatidate cytidylyltransferase
MEPASMRAELTAIEPTDARSVGAGRDRLRLRVCSALTLAPLPIAAIWFGPPWLPLLTTLAAAIMAWEWARLCRGGARNSAAAPVATTLVAAVLAAVASAAVEMPGIAIPAAIFGAAIVLSAARTGAQPAPGWTALGVLWIALPCISWLWLARQQADRPTLFWLLAVVWATDIGAYAIGRTLGGPRLAPRLSPRKTWSGFAGGILCASLTGAAAAQILRTSPAPAIVLSAGLAIVAQFGDLAESLAKRRFRVKDSSGLIPGHGGLLDRLDGLLAAILALALLTLFAGHGVLIWR